jgi:hypothetical protein
MFARRVTMKLEPNSVPEFTRRLEKDVIPLLQKQIRALKETFS